jgi:ppGpp synthetase/RelA/SpoT-type nucleotidyltranferase
VKIVKRVRDLHDECKPRYDRLSDEIREILKPRSEERNWFYLGRVKELESFALKIETGRTSDPARMEDFFACTIVVPTLGQIEDAERLVSSLFDSIERRPPSDAETRKTASDFAFDDLRLYVARRPAASGRASDLDGMVFEVQIKTILQHAWSVATHDLIYKSDSVSWARERIAFQVKAMLEHAEIVIAEANRLADASAVAKKDERTAGILRLIEEIARIWPREKLPKDLKRLAETILKLLQICDLKADDFGNLVDGEKKRIGLLPANISPYAFTLQALANSQKYQFEQKFRRGHVRTRVVIHDGMELPKWMLEDHPRILNLSGPVSAGNGQ